MARPRKEVDENLLDRLAAVGLTTSEIASILEVSPDTLERNYAEEMREGKEKAKASVRRKQFELAMAGNPTMLVWLGKNLLGQTDRIEHTGELGIKTVVVPTTLKSATERPSVAPAFEFDA